MTPTEELATYIALIRNRTTNTIEEWNLMIDAETALEREKTNED